MKVRLRNVNRWLRWTGFRMFIAFSHDANKDPRDLDTAWFVGLKWFGLPGSRGWRQIEGQDI